MEMIELKDKALTLPLEPGVYIMRDKNDRVIYVGKAKKLKNRVSQYFQETASHSPKTRLMVSRVDHFEVIVAATEFEALVLECSLIKRYMPKYNILLKDDKGYPYLRLDMKEQYPKITLVGKIASDGAQYFGPYGSRGVTNALLEALQKTLQLPSCSKIFPRDVGKDRPCLNYHMNTCAGWCQANKTQTQYRELMLQAQQLLRGNYKEVAQRIKEEMILASDRLEFELAASLRDRLRAVESLGQKQLLTAGNMADTDVIGYSRTETKACFAVLHFSGGNLLDKDYQVFAVPDDPAAAVSSLLKQFYLSRGFAPKRVMLPFELDDGELFAQLMEQNYGIKTKIRIPQRGDNAKLVEIANKNALEEAKRMTDQDEKHSAVLQLLGNALSIELPKRIESYDISNISGTDIVAGMVVFRGGKPAKSQYKKFKLQGLSDQDDYASMRQIILRRFTDYKDAKKGFEEGPDLLLIDGGATHAAVALEALQQLNLHFPVFGMVKDDRHRTRALVTPQGDEIQIDHDPALFSLIGTIQEETHRFAISYHRQLRSKRLKYSQLDSIAGIGPKRKQLLLKHFKSLQAIKSASIAQLERVLTKDAAMAVYQHYHSEKE